MRRSEVKINKLHFIKDGPTLRSSIVTGVRKFQWDISNKENSRFWSVRLSSLDYENAYLHFLGVAFVQLQ